MPLQATSGAASYDAFGGGVAAVPNYIEDVFSTYLYTGNGSTQTITNGIDLAGKGGMTWIKGRSIATSNQLFDTVRGAGTVLISDNTGQQSNNPNSLSSFNSDGFSLGTVLNVNWSTYTFASWTFRKQPKFFDVVTFTSDGTTAQAISHSLGSVPAFIVIKRTDSTGNWIAWHRGDGTTDRYTWSLNNTAAAASSGSVFVSAGYFNSTSFQPNRLDDHLGNKPVSGGTYVAYLFAHNAGGFGLTGTDNVISCGSYSGTGAAGNAITLGYEPQWVMVKRSNNTGDWMMFDNMRGMANDGLAGAGARLQANLADAEVSPRDCPIPTATGFVLNSTSTALNGSGSTYIYIAIRRGPMKVPTSGTSVFSPIARAGTSATANISTGFVTDATIIKNRAGGFVGEIFDRLRGANTRLYPDQTSAESTTTDHLTSFATNDGYALGASASGEVNLSGYNYANWNFRRAPSFMDAVCYSGTGVAKTETHNLKAVPELMIVKSRAGTGRDWAVYTSATAATNFMYLNGTDASGASSSMWNDTSPTSSVFTVGTNLRTNNSGQTYVAYLFATCAGVSKVGSYTGNGSSQTINCGFTGGARFVLIKRTDSTGDWYVWDTARGIVASNDSHLSLNTTAAEVTTDDTIDTNSTGFVVNQVTATNVNVSSATYIFLAIA